MKGMKIQCRLMAVVLALVVCGGTAAAASKLPSVKTRSVSRSSYISSFHVKPQNDGWCKVSMNVHLSADVGGSCGTSSSKQRADFVVYFDWEGKGSSLDLHNIGHHEFTKSGSFCVSKKVYMPSKAKGTVWARAIIGVGEFPSSATKMPYAGDYKDTSFDAGCEPPTLYRVNIGTYAEGGLVPSSLIGKISKYNAAIAGKDCKVYPLFKMTEETMKYLNSKGGFWVKCGSDKQTKFKTSPVSKLSDGYNVYAMSAPLKFKPSVSTKQADYGEKQLEISYGGTATPSTQKKSWPYYLFFDVSKTSGGDPLWFKVWKDVLPGMKQFSYDPGLSDISDLEYTVDQSYSTDEWNQFEYLRKYGNEGDTMPRPVRIKRRALGKGVAKSALQTVFDVGNLFLAPSSAMEAAYFGCRIENEKKDLLCQLTQKLDIDWVGNRKFVPANDDDVDCVDDNVEKKLKLSTKSADTFGVRKKYKKLSGTGDLEYAARGMAILDDFASKYGKKDWSCPNGYQSGYLDLATSVKAVRSSLKSAGVPSDMECHSAVLSDEEVVEELTPYVSTGEETPVAAVTELKETTSDFENEGLEFTLTANLPESGEYEFSAHLVDLSGIPFARTKTTGMFESGSNAIPLRFSPETMAQAVSVRPGPWKISAVTIGRRFEEEATVRSRIEVTPCVCADYSGRTPEVAGVVLAGMCSDELRKGKIIVSVPVCIPSPGDWTFRLGLATASDARDFATCEVSNRFERGVATVDFVFTPEMMRPAKCGGPYFVGDLAVVPADGEGSVVEIAHVTQAYAYEDVSSVKSDLAIVINEDASLWAERTSWNVGPYSGVHFTFGVDCRTLKSDRKVRFESVLADADGMEVAAQSQTGVVQSGFGDEVLEVVFDMAGIIEANCCGPFTVTRLSLYDDDTDELLDECAATGIWSEELDADGLVPGTVPAVDEDGASADFEWSENERILGIRFVVPVQSDYSGDIFGTAELYGADGTYVDTVSASAYAYEGQLSFLFDGAKIRSSGVDGPYEIRNLSVYSETFSDLVFESERTFVSEGCSHGDFAPNVYRFSPVPNGVGPFSGRKGAYDCVLLTLYGELVGTVRVTVDAANKSGVSAVTAKITRYGTKALSLSGKTDKKGVAVLSAKKIKDKCSLSVGNAGVEGTWGDYVILGARDEYTVKGGVAVTELAAVAKGGWTVMADSTLLQLVVDSKGGVTVSGIDGNGHSFSAKSRVIRGEGFVYIPVYVAKTKKTSAFHTWVKIDTAGGMSFLDGDGMGFAGYPSGGRTEKPSFWSEDGMTEDLLVGTRYSRGFSPNQMAYPYKFSAKNLPDGLKLNATTGVISGVPKKAGTKKVTLTMSSIYKKNWKASLTVTLAVAPIPREFIGTFVGVARAPWLSEGDATGNAVGTVTLTTTKTGKLSGKIVVDGKTWKLSDSAFSGGYVYWDGKWRVSINAKAVCGKQVNYFSWAFGQDEFTTEDIGSVSLLEYGVCQDWSIGWMPLETEVELHRAVWKDKGASASLTQWVGKYTALTRDGGRLSLTLNAQGNVMFAGKLPDGRTVKTSSTLIAMSGERFVWLVLPEDKKHGYARVSERFWLDNSPGTPTPGEIACRDPGVRLTQTTGGTVKMDMPYGQASSGKKVKLTATVKKGYAFLGWFDADGNLVTQSAAYSHTMTGTDVFLTARFAKESALAVPVLSWNAATNLTVGVSYSATPKVSGEAAVKIVSVSGLPAGLAYKSGKVSGAPTAVKAYTVSVKVALATNSKKTWTLKQRLVVAALPDWAKGTFDGGFAEGTVTNQVTLTVGSTGKVSGKLNFANASWTLSGTKLSTLDAEERTATLSLTAKKGTTKKTVSVMVGADELGGWASSETSGFAFEARQNLWKKDDAWAACAAELVDVEYADPAGDLTVTFGANGTATAKLKVGKNTFPCSSVLCPTAIGEDLLTGRLYLYFAPNTKKNFKGAVRVVEVEL